MPATLDISYYNTFLLKQVTEYAPEGMQLNTPIWPKGFPYNEYIEISEAKGPLPCNASNSESINILYV